MNTLDVLVQICSLPSSYENWCLVTQIFLGLQLSGILHEKSESVVKDEWKKVSGLLKSLMIVKSKNGLEVHDL